MKKSILLLGIVAAATLTTFTSCDKLKEVFFVAFNANSASVEFTIPIVTDITQKSDIGTVKNTINIDSIIKAETSGQFAMGDIKKITVEQAKLTLLDADADNNFANFEEGWLEFHTDAKPTPVLIATGPNPDEYRTEWVLPAVAGVNLKDYLTGTELFYALSAKARRATTKTLLCKLEVRFHIE
jgi:hypothetical protein